MSKSDNYMKYIKYIHKKQVHIMTFFWEISV